MMNQTCQDTQYIYRMPRTNDRTGIRIAVIGQKGPLFVVEDEKTIDFITGQCNHDKIEK